MTTTSTIASTLHLDLIPQEIYHSPGNKHIIRLGNGGAGPSGVLNALAKDYQRVLPNASTIAWYRNISPLTLEALRHGKLDIALTYERDQEAAAVAAGWAKDPVLVFNDHFVLVGPQHDPANVLKALADSVDMKARDLKVELATHRARVAFQALATFASTHPSTPLFVSRHDNSATNLKERALWELACVTLPAPDSTAGDNQISDSRTLSPAWYVTLNVFPADALRYADKHGLYTLIDHGTYGMLKQELDATRILLAGGTILLNPCNALLSQFADNATKEFLKYLLGQGQKIISKFGEQEYERILYTNRTKLDLT